MEAVGSFFGGKVALDMARLDVDLGGGFSLHRNLTLIQKATPGKVKAKAHVLIGTSIQLCLKGWDGPSKN